MSAGKRLPIAALLLATTLCMAVASGAEQPPPTESDFAFGASIRLGAPGPLHELPLPLSVYRHATRADLGDLRVFNAAGNVVPHGLLPGPLQAPPERRRVKLPAFPAQVGAPLSASGLDVRIDQSDGRTRVQVRGGAGVTNSETAWLVDASGLTETPLALLLSWPAKAAPFTRRVQLEGSHDLSRWYRLGDPATIADVSWSGERLLANRIELSSRRYPWLRAVAADGSKTLPELAFEAELAPTDQGRAPREWMAVMPTPATEYSGELRFTTPAALPVERLRIVPVERNTYLQLRIEARKPGNQKWLNAGNGSVYRLDFENAPLVSAPLTVATAGAVEWRLLPSEAAASTGGSFGSAPPEVEVGWTPRSLVFLARGDGPYTLAFGSRRASPVLTDGRRLLGNDITILGLPLASAGETRPLGDAEQALTARRDIDWKQIALWVVLVAGALLLTLLAWRLLHGTGGNRKA